MNKTIWNNAQLNQMWLSLKRYYAMNLTVYEMDFHIHDEIEIMYVLYGECIVAYKDSFDKEHDILLEKGQYIVIDANVAHQLIIPRDSLCRLLNLEFRLVPSSDFYSFHFIKSQSPLFTTYSKWLNRISTQTDRDGELFRIITMIQFYEQASYQLSEKKVFLSNSYCQFLIVLAKQGLEKPQNLGNFYIQKAKEYLALHLEESFTVEMIAQNIGISTAYLQRLFKQSESVTIIEYCNQLRIEKAKVLLQYSNLNIIDIAILVGFHTRQHFSKMFLQKVGITPGQFRKENANFNGY